MNIAEQQKKRYLRACPLFEGLQEDVISRVASRAHNVLLPRGKVLFYQDDPSDGLYILCSGLVRVSITDEEGNALTLALPENGAPLGEMTLVSSDRRSATVTALEDTSLLHLEIATTLALLSEEPKLAAHLIEFLSRRLRQSNDTLHKFAFENLQQRLLQKLAELGLQHGSLEEEVLDLGRKFSQNALAEMLGVTREAVNKQLKLLQDKDIVTMENGIIQLRRPAEIIKNLPNP
ncbi:Crp/Fnr family transcriptional regulator [uncultured Roseovarius sp.]|uniref:Crp/Fnr family transcriptional regulator n=1 Tax=uncultured Roseovarius sp. TaxID=293344 RepID=UPI002639D754|nr:Crp/Fnr family transcriptional regulator [uncultured Roseovarius sp.]